MRTTAIIVNYRTPELSIECIRALQDQRLENAALNIVLVDNHSQDGSVAFFRKVLTEEGWEHSIELLALDQNGGFGWANNQAMLRILQRDFPPEAVLLINPDARAQPGAVAALIRVLNERPGVGAVGSQLIDVAGSLSGSAFRFPSVGREWTRGHGRTRLSQLFGIMPGVFEAGRDRTVDWVTGASVLLRVDALRRVGLFDTGFFLYFEEVELMFRLKKGGWTTVHASDSRVVHMEGASTGLREGRSAASSAPPAYVLESRRRFFALKGGAVYAWLAGMAWLLGEFQARACRSIFGRRPTDPDKRERIALRRVGLWPRRVDRVAFVTRADDRWGDPPAWMSFP